MTDIHIVIVALYLLLVLFSSFIYSSINRGFSAYYLSNKNLSWGVAGLSAYVSCFTNLSLLGGPTVVFKNSFSLITTLLIYPLTIFFSLKIIQICHEKKAVTAFDLLKEKFNKKETSFIVILYFLMRYLWICGAIVGIGRLVSDVFNFNNFVFVTFLVVFTVSYALVGGFDIDVKTDVLQFFIIVCFVVVVFLLLSYDIGLSSLVKISLQNRDWHFFDSFKRSFGSSIFLISVCLINAVFNSIDQIRLQRFLSTKSHLDAKRALYFAGIIGFTFSSVMYFLGYVLYGFAILNTDSVSLDLWQSDSGVLSVFVTKFYPGLLSLLLVAALSSLMSSLDSVLNSTLLILERHFFSLSRVKSKIIISFFIGIIFLILYFVVSEFKSFGELMLNPFIIFAPGVCYYFFIGVNKIDIPNSICHFVAGTSSIIGYLLVISNLVEYTAVTFILLSYCALVTLLYKVFSRFFRLAI